MIFRLKNEYVGTPVSDLRPSTIIRDQHDHLILLHEFVSFTLVLFLFIQERVKQIHLGFFTRCFTYIVSE